MGYATAYTIKFNANLMEVIALNSIFNIPTVFMQMIQVKLGTAHVMKYTTIEIAALMVLIVVRLTQKTTQIQGKLKDIIPSRSFCLHTYIDLYLLLDL